MSRRTIVLPNMLREEWIRLALEENLVAPYDTPLIEALLAMPGFTKAPARCLENIAHVMIVAAHKLRTTEP